jgi:biopolymer transport protein ExbD
VRWHTATRKGEVSMEEVVYADFTKITPLLAPRVKANPAYRAVIRADRETPARFVSKVMAICAEAGIDDITFSVLNRE